MLPKRINMRISTKSIITIVLYVVLIVFLAIAIWAESRDIRCSEFRSKQCGPGMGCAYAAGKPNDKDNLETLLNKIRSTARYEVNSIMWRRAFIAAALTAFVILYVTKKKLPSGIHLASAFLICYIILYLMLTMFQKWITDPALHQLDDLLDRVRDKTSK